MVKQLDFGKIIFYTVILIGSFIAGIILTDMPDSNIVLTTVINEDIIHAPSAAAEMIDGKININSATARTLQNLDGIGEKLSQRIIDYRTENGEFTSPENIMDVPGIGEKTFNDIKNFICVK